METTIYKGFLVGVVPSLTRLTSHKDLSECWVGRSATLEVKNATTINLSFNWNGHEYLTTNCKLIKPDQFQLIVNSNGGWDDKAFLTLYKNETGIVVKGSWKSTSESEVWGEFMKIENT